MRPNSPGWQIAMQANTQSTKTFVSYVKQQECALRGRAVLAAQTQQLNLARQKADKPAT